MKKTGTPIDPYLVEECNRLSSEINAKKLILELKRRKKLQNVLPDARN